MILTKIIDGITIPLTQEEIDLYNYEQHHAGESGYPAVIHAIRQQRNILLAACDWTQCADVPLNPEKLQEWRIYRQQLRDYMSQVTDPLNPPPFPTIPSI